MKFIIIQSESPLSPSFWNRLNFPELSLHLTTKKEVKFFLNCQKQSKKNKLNKNRNRILFLKTGKKAMQSITKLFQNLQLLKTQPQESLIVRHIYKYVTKPKPGRGKAYRRIVHYPEEYTVKPLEVTNLAGRDPVTGRMVAKGIGGGIKYKFHWIKWVREGPTEGPPKLEKVMDVLFDGCRTAKIALVAVQDEMKYILATENMKAGDIIKTSRFIPRIPG